jgi:hypothetical protein
MFIHLVGEKNLYSGEELVTLLREKVEASINSIQVFII